ncbi:MAG: ankyrin repeat domain-containing protein [Simkania sp.]|nr:ankyrin repeat domain-containing protein [Simkania sp.]MCB1076053.1 ankyrin repeat domain-containing protein [Simkania sp.]MCP5491289.1 ankyrin repeat domain-containing protein [Chlamydiales bacterium]
MKKHCKIKSSVYEKDGEGQTALHHASVARRKNIVKQLLLTGADVNLAMAVAVKYGKNEVVEVLWNERKSLRLGWQYFRARIGF